MTHDEIVSMAQECNLIGMRPHLDGIYSESLIAFAQLVAAKEREACAKVCAQYDDDPLVFVSIEIAKAIRARGNT